MPPELTRQKTNKIKLLMVLQEKSGASCTRSVVMVKKMREVRPIYIILFILAVAGGVFFALKNKQKTAVEAPIPIAVQNNHPEGDPAPQEPETVTQNQETPANNQNVIPDIQPPLDRAGERVTKKTFGIFITPQNSPVQPEKFSGYHTGADFEIFPEELKADVAVHAVCSGKLLSKKYASGYGGVAIESCEIDNQIITVVYGHLKLASIGANVGDDLNVGDTVGILGADSSVETDGERKHLHLGFHKGSSINILGYVQNKTDLFSWIDPCLYVCQD